MARKKGMSDKAFSERREYILDIIEKNEQLEKLQIYLARQGMSCIQQLESELKRRRIQNPFKDYDMKSLPSVVISYGHGRTDDEVLTTEEACAHLKLSRPTYLKYIHEGRIKATKAGKGWKVYKSELDRVLRGE